MLRSMPPRPTALVTGPSGLSLRYCILETGLSRRNVVPVALSHWVLRMKLVHYCVPLIAV
jgi:predicted DNA-binding transcriptional regulator YafY